MLVIKNDYNMKKESFFLFYYFARSLLTCIGEMVKISHSNTPSDTLTALFLGTLERDPAEFENEEVKIKNEFLLHFCFELFL